MMQMELLDIIKILLRWIFDKKVRMQLAGYRPEVICLVKENSKLGRFLIIKPNADPSIWVPPHEGIMLNETIEDAALRCLSIELGLKECNIQFRKSIWLGKRMLPRERWDERDLQYSLRGVFSKYKMIGKAYFGAYIIADATAEVVPNGAEIHYWEWVSREEFLQRIETNSSDKLSLLQNLFSKLSI